MAGIPKHASFIATLISLFVSAATAQNASLLCIDVIPHDTCSYFGPLHKVFGNDLRGTYGADSALGEFECPPLAPPPYDAYWSPIPGRVQSTFGGAVRCGPDIRGWTSSAQVDTFRLIFFDICDSIRSFSFHWPDTSYLARHCDSMFLFDTLGQPYRADMFKTDSVEIPFAPGEFRRQVLIVKYGAKLVDVVTGVTTSAGGVPLAFGLGEAYPNPFNPSTQIQYSVPQSAFVTLTVYDVLGRDVVTLVHGWTSPGIYEVRWNASGMASGIYYYRMMAASSQGGFTTVRKLILAR